MSDRFDFGKLAYELIAHISKVMVELHPEIIHGEGDMTLFQQDEYSELEQSVAEILSHAGEKQGQWCMWFLRQEDIIEVYNELYGGEYDLTGEQEKRVVSLFGDDLNRKVTYWRDTLATAVEQVMEE